MPQTKKSCLLFSGVQELTIDLGGELRKLVINVNGLLKEILGRVDILKSNPSGNLSGAYVPRLVRGIQRDPAACATCGNKPWGVVIAKAA